MPPAPLRRLGEAALRSGPARHHGPFRSQRALRDRPLDPHARAGPDARWAWDASSFGLPPHYNPSLCWRDLLAAGFPFVKRKLLSDHPRFREARREVLEHARAHFGADLA